MANRPMRCGTVSIGDGGVITHGLGQLPRSVNVVGSVAGTFANVTALTATTMTVSLRTGLGAGATQTVYWQVFV